MLGFLLFQEKKEKHDAHNQICALGKTTLVSSPNMKWHIFKAYFSYSARFTDRCAHGSLLARGRSSALTTYFPVWCYITTLNLYCPVLREPQIDCTLLSENINRTAHVSNPKCKSASGSFNRYVAPILTFFYPYLMTLRSISNKLNMPKLLWFVNGRSRTLQETKDTMFT